MRKYNINANLVRTTEQLYDKTTSAVQINGNIGEWFRTIVGVRQGCLMSPTLFNIFLERIMSDALEDEWMDDLRFYVLLTVFQSYQDDVGMIMRGCVQWNSVYVP